MEVIHFEADGSDLTGAVTQTYRERKKIIKERERERERERDRPGGGGGAAAQF